MARQRAECTHYCDTLEYSSYCLLLTEYCLLLTDHCVLRTAHCSLLTAHCLLNQVEWNHDEFGYIKLRRYLPPRVRDVMRYHSLRELK